MKLNIKASRLTKDILEDESRIVINSGGTSCFHGGQLVVTKNESKSISELTTKDEVLSFSESTGKDEFKKVVNVLKFKNAKRTIKVTLKNGQSITATEDHKFFFNGGWHSLKHIVSLLNGNMENNRGI